jgi:hypothetical protein
MWRYFLINLTLSCLAIFLAFRLYEIWNAPMEEVSLPQKKTEGKGKAEAPEVKKDIGIYQGIVQKDLFRPSRTEYKPDIAKSGLPPSPPPKLFGVLIMDNNRIAILEDPSSKRRKNYHLGDNIGDFVISEIEKDKVILLRGEEKVVVSIREIKTISPPTKPGATPRPTPRPAPPTQRPPIPLPPPQPIHPMPESVEEFPEVAPLPEFGP